ncbi:MAG: hypothetical protein WBM98_14970, partial [Maribacter sp.]
MDDKLHRKVSILGPGTFTKIKLKTAAQYAAGLPGVKAAMSHVFKEMGVVRSLQALSNMNQKEGFECPSCAWPDPDEPSKIGEFCENG